MLQLSGIHFDRGEYQQALQYAQKATRVAPRSAAAHLELGDAYFKVHRYDETRREYERAAELGHGGAAKALQRLDRRVGEP